MKTDKKETKINNIKIMRRSQMHTGPFLQRFILYTNFKCFNLYAILYLTQIPGSQIDFIMFVLIRMVLILVKIIENSKENL